MEKIYQKINSLKIRTVGVIFFALGFIIYGNALTSPFIWDDHLIIVNNVFIQDWKYWPQYFSQYLFAGAGVEGDYWRPLQTLSFALDYHAGGLNPFAYHTVNVLWHILAAVLAYAVLAKIFNHKPAAFLSALVFLVHPLQTEAITYISGRADPMIAVFLFLSFLFFWKYASGNGKKNLLFSLLFFALSFLAKERAVLFPGIILLYLFTLFPKKIPWNWKNKLLSAMPFVIITAAYLALREIIMPIDTESLYASESPEFLKTALVFFKFTGTYVQLFIFPLKLFMQRPVEMGGFFDPYVLTGLVFIIVSVAGFILSLKKRCVWAFGIGWFWIFFIFSFFSFMRMGFLMEHWLYLPMLGLLAPFFILILEKVNSERVFARGTGYVLIFLVVILFSARAIIRNRDWQNPVRFYEKNIALGSYSAQIYNNLGMEYFSIGKDREAVSLFNQAIVINNRLPGSWYNLAMIYEKYGEMELAEKYYLATLERDPLGIPIYEALQTIYNAQGKIDEAIYITEESLKIQPDNSFMLANLGLLYESRGDTKKARLYLQKALNLDPENQKFRKALEKVDGN